MLINVNNFKKWLNKATLNYYIESVQLNFDVEKNLLWTKMTSSTKSSAVILKTDNDIFSDVKEDITLNFSSPKTEVKPFLDLIDDDEVELKILENKIVLNNQLKLHFDDPSTISTLSSDGPLDSIKYFVDFKVDENFVNIFKKIKKIGSRFKKIYFTVDSGVLYIETTDKSLPYSNGINFDLCKVKNKDTSLCFDYFLFVNMMSVINGEYEKFNIKISNIQDNEGLIYALKGDEERYFIMSLME